jgi:hypothetical protein
VDLITLRPNAPMQDLRIQRDMVVSVEPPNDRITHLVLRKGHLWGRDT